MNKSSAQRPQARPRDYRRAARALAALKADSSQTEQVFEIIQALTGDSFEPTCQRFFADPYGQELLATRPRLADVLRDHARLSRLPEGSFGRAYFEFATARGMTPEGLTQARAQAKAEGDDNYTDPDREYISLRLTDMHDLWHVLTDYGTDEAGEVANLWFSIGQFANPGMMVVALLGSVYGPRTGSWVKYLWNAYQRGRRAKPLVSAPIEHLLDRPLEEVRRELHIVPTHVMHPKGIYVGNGNEPGGLGGRRVQASRSGLEAGAKVIATTSVRSSTRPSAYPKPVGA